MGFCKPKSAHYWHMFRCRDTDVALKNGLVIAGSLIGAASSLLIGFMAYHPQNNFQRTFAHYFDDSGLVFLVAGTIVGGAIGYVFSLLRKP